MIPLNLASKKLSTYSYIMLMRDREMANRDKAKEAAEDTPSCSAKNKGRVAPSDQQQRPAKTNDNDKPGGLNEEEKRNFGMELRNGVGEKQCRPPTQLATSPSWGLPPQPSSSTSVPPLAQQRLTLGADVSPKSSIRNPTTDGRSSSSEASPAVTSKQKRKRKTRKKTKQKPVSPDLAQTIEVSRRWRPNNSREIYR